MTQYEHVASFGVDPRVVWIDPNGAGHQYSPERTADLYRAITATGAIATGLGETWATRAGVYLRAAGERTKAWKAAHPEFDPKDEYMIQADGDIVKRDQGLNPILMASIVLAAPIAAVVLPGMIAGAGAAGATTAGSATAAAGAGVSATVGTAIATGSSIALGVYQTHQRNEAIEAQQAAAAAAQAQQAAQNASGGLLGGIDTTTLLMIAAIVVVAVVVRR